MSRKSFRGKLTDGEQELIRLGTNQGLIGYKVKKFAIIPALPTTGGAKEATVQVFTTERDTVSTTTATINFDDPTLLAVATWVGSDNPIYTQHQQVIFDHVKFNQDIYITHTNTDGAAEMNYYLELEKVKLDLGEATVATLKDMRGNYTNQDP